MGKRALLFVAIGISIIAGAGAAKNASSRKSHGRRTMHLRARKHASHKVTKSRAHHGGALHARPNGTVVPRNLKPSPVPGPEILKKKGPLEG